MNSIVDLPHTITYAIMYRDRLDSFNELPKDKRPPRNLWDKPYALSQYLSKIWDTDKTEEKSQYLYDLEDLE